jgi:hypothetical protein
LQDSPHYIFGVVVLRQVSRSKSNEYTPLLTIFSFVSLLGDNAASRQSVQSKGVFGLSKCLKGDIISVLQKQYATWFTNPYNAFTPERMRGVEKSLIEVVYLSAGLIPSSVIMNPANYTSLLANLNFLALNTGSLKLDTFLVT